MSTTLFLITDMRAFLINHTPPSISNTHSHTLVSKLCSPMHTHSHTSLFIIHRKLARILCFHITYIHLHTSLFIIHRKLARILCFPITYIHSHTSLFIIHSMLVRKPSRNGLASCITWLSVWWVYSSSVPSSWRS